MYNAPAGRRLRKGDGGGARSVVERLRGHPCVALWAGDNENDQSFYWLFNSNAFKIDPAKERVSREVFPRVLFELDPTRPYLPSSPYYSPDVFEDRASPSEVHLWGPRGYYKAPYYTSGNAHFVSEIGYHGCPNRESLEKMFDKSISTRGPTPKSSNGTRSGRRRRSPRSKAISRAKRETI